MPETVQLSSSRTPKLAIPPPPELAEAPDAAAIVEGGVRPLSELPYTSSLEPAFMDRSVDPCVDFYAYSCNGWRAQNPIPPDQSRWSVYGKLYNENQQYLWGLP